MNLQTLESVLAKDTFSDEELLAFLSLTDAECCSRLWREAYDRTTRVHGNALWFRGLIEISNYCIYDCRYCGIRKGNRLAQRYTLTPEEIVEAARYAVRAGYGSVALQAGERTDEKFIAFVEDVLRRIHRMSVKEGIAEGCGVTLSFGEQTEETYERWAQAAGNRKALRYLLRIESSNPELFHRLHCTPGKHEKILEHRYEALANLRKAGYQVGTGVMIGLPGQTIEDLVQDIRTFEKVGADMIGMGPYLTSLGADMVSLGQMPHDDLLRLSLNMIAATRLVLRNVNIAAATALETLEPRGRIMGILHGCNVVMPNITPQMTRASYQLYDNKAGTEVGAESNILVENDIVRIAHRSLGLNRLGSSRRWVERTGRPAN